MWTTGWDEEGKGSRKNEEGKTKLCQLKELVYDLFFETMPNIPNQIPLTSK
jgi:hypothetical protein